ncbi:SH3 domain-containing protein [Candidatus Latescibacterota bacterium]
MKKLLFLAVFVSMVLYGCAIFKPPVYTGPFLVPAEGPVPGVPADVEYADYWIRTSLNPDNVILTPDEIEEFNNKNPQDGTYIMNIPDMPDEIDGSTIREYIAENARYLIDVSFFVTADIPLERVERHRIAALMDTANVPDVIPVRFGVMLRRTMGKTWPTTIPFMIEPGDNEFDQGVISSIDMGEPVALLHTSWDNQWSYVRTYGFAGWIPSDTAAFGDRQTVKELTDRTTPLVAVGHRVSVYGSPESGAATGSIQMGSYLPLRTAGTVYCEVLIPGRGENNELVAKKGYVRRSSNISLGFLPYTLRNVYRQCFALYGRRYGWGGMFGERDCSRFCMDVFRCFGFRLPRNSSKQAQASHCVLPLEDYDRESRLEILKSTPGGITLLGMPGHIMIYLGNILGKPYAISAFWAWRTPSGSVEDIAHRAARVAVTDLMLGEWSQKGAFIDRLNYLAIMGNYTFEKQ